MVLPPLVYLCRYEAHRLSAKEPGWSCSALDLYPSIDAFATINVLLDEAGERGACSRMPRCNSVYMRSRGSMVKSRIADASTSLHVLNNHNRASASSLSCPLTTMVSHADEMVCVSFQQ